MNDQAVKNYDVEIKHIVTELERKGYENIRTVLDDYESPAKIVRQSNEEEIIPDITATRNGKKSYFEVAKKVDEMVLVRKWKLLSTLAEMKSGVFEIFVPKGHLRFTQDITTKHDINANITKLW